MKKRICLVAALLALCLAACSSQAAAPAPVPATEVPAMPAPETPAPAPAQLVNIDGNVISVKDDGSGHSSDEGDMKKTVYLTNENVSYIGEAGPMRYEVTAIQISKINMYGDTAKMLDLEDGQDAALVAIKLTVENTSADDISWYPNQSTIITSDKEQVNAHLFLSDSVGGTFMGNVVKQGQLFFICKNTNAETLSHLQWRIRSPHDSKYNHIGEDIVIEFDFPKG